MDDLTASILSMAGPNSTIKVGLVESTPAGTVVNVDGVYPTPYWLGAAVVRPGDAVAVLVDGRACWVLETVSTRPSPEFGTVTSPASGGYVMVRADDGRDYKARYIGVAPSTGTQVLLLWQSTQPVAMPGTLAATPTPTPPVVTPPPAPPPAPTTGTESIVANDAALWSSTGGWSSGGPAQGYYSPRSYQGGWWYGSFAQLAGATITGARFYVHRVRAGVYGAVTIKLALINSAPRQGSGVSVVSGPTDIASLPIDTAGWFTIPADWGQRLVNGTATGIGLQSGDYAKCAALGEDAASGQLQLDWKR